ncbi:ABC transporter ATP-binding protein [Corynebacterium kroppenstedtii]|uniref:ABC transporter ATP-binding protein n=1 Tax=Corynebacterium sp. PCR 32 TaxID=3351342 RepID=UPI003099658D
MNVAVEFDQVTKAFRKRRKVTTALDNFTAHIPSGVSCCFIGPNGSGKSTAFNLLTGLLAPGEGSVKTFGHNPSADQKAVAKLSAIQLQSSKLFPSLTAEDMLTLWSHIYGNAKSPKSILTSLKMEYFKDRPIEKLSGGQYQLVSVASALIANAPLTILDEPTNNLSPEVKANVWDYISKYAKDREKTLIFSTHTMEDAEKYSDWVVLLNGGKTLYVGPTNELISKAFPLSQEISFTVSLEHSEDEVFKNELNKIMKNEVNVGQEKVDDGIAYIISTQPEEKDRILHDIARLDNIKDLNWRKKNLEDTYNEIVMKATPLELD